MLWIKSNYDSSPSFLIENVKSLDQLYQEIKDRKGIPIYLQRLEYSGRELTEQGFNEMNQTEINSIYLNVRYFNIDIKSLVNQIVLNGNDLVVLNQIPTLIKNKYYKPIYCCDKENIIQIVFRSIHYNNREIYPIWKDNTRLIVQTATKIFEPEYYVDTFGDKGVNILTIYMKKFSGLSHIRLLNIGINSDPEIDKNIKILLLVSNLSCTICGKDLLNKYVLLTGPKQGYDHKYVHLDCLK